MREEKWLLNYKKMETKSNFNLLLVLEEKPRASKTSTRHKIEGLNFFFKCSEAGTGGHILIYYDAPPYPYIKLIATEIADKDWLKGNDERFIKKAKDWIIENKTEIIKRLKNIKDYVQINEKLWRENDKIPRGTNESKQGFSSM